MKSVLIVSPRFPPSAAPDYHRVRMMLPLMQQHGWKPVVLCVDSKFVEGPRDDDLLSTIPASVEVVTCRAIPLSVARRFGVGGLSPRARPFIRIAAERLLRDRRIDLSFFSTTEFPILPLGLRWLRKFHVPFVVDLQDPWVNPYYSDNDVRPPGGLVKHALHQAYARRQERKVLEAAAHIAAVSPRYPVDLMRRYPLLTADRFSVIPFGAAQSDLNVARQTEQKVFDPSDGRTHWIYAGAVVPGMFPAITAFFDALHRAWEDGIVEPGSLRIHFVGTDYAPGKLATERVAPIAKRIGVGSFVEERAQRIPYLTTLRCLIDADALLVFGSDEAGYTASKLFTYVLARRPLLTIFHEQSSVTSAMREMNAGVDVSFEDRIDGEALSRAVFEKWFARRGFENVPETRWESFHSHSAESMTGKLARIFDRAIATRRTASNSIV